MRDADVLPQADQAPGCPHPREVYALTGHAQAEAKISKILGGDKIHHAWLITGPKGVGKATLAYRVVRRILGGTPATEGALDVPPGDPVSQRVESLGHGDLLLIRRPYDHKSKKIKTEIPVKEMRRIQEFFNKKAAEGGWRVCLVDSADEMNPNSANALLKSLEEPPNKALVILLSSAPGRLLPTIHSRCLHIPLRPLSDKDMTSWLADQRPEMSDTERRETALYSRGSPGRAMALSENYKSVFGAMNTLKRALQRNDTSAYHDIAQSFSTVKMESSRDLLWEVLVDHIEASAKAARCKEPSPLGIDKHEKAWLEDHASIRKTMITQKALNMDVHLSLLSAFSTIGSRR